MKTCRRCNATKDPAAFYRDASAKDGRQDWCKQCFKDHERTPRGKDARRRAGDRYSATAKGWAAEARADRVRRVAGNLDVDSVAYVAVLRHDRCTYCGDAMSQIDHIVAISRGGDSRWDNLTASCAACNREKYANSLLVFLADRLHGAGSAV